MSRRPTFRWWAAILIAAMAGYATEAAAQSSSNYSAGNMWGTASSGVSVPGAVDSAITHTQNGVLAGHVNAAEAGLLLNSGIGTSLNISSVGSQTIVSSTVVGNSNDVDIDANQTSSNSGDVSNSGTVTTNN